MNEFKNVIGYEDVKMELSKKIDFIKNPQKYEKVKAKMSRGILLHGEPGLGKTLMAKCFIRAAGCKAYTLHKNLPDGEFVKEIRRVFEQAKDNTPSVVFLDDIDKFSNGDYNHRNTDEFVTLQSCIDECKDHQVFVIATANDLDNIPDSLLRAGRFDDVLEMRPPKKKDAAKIIAFYLKGRNCNKDVDVDELSILMDGRSCAALETVVNEAALNAGFNGHDDIQMSDMVEAIMKVVYEAPKSLEEREPASVKKIAVHEAGHALIAELLEPGSVSMITVERHSGDVGGVTIYNQNEHYFEDISYMENRVIALMGGRAATEIVYGTVDVGATSDLKRAQDITNRIYHSYKMFGFNNLYGQPSEQQQMLDEIRVEQMLQQYYDKAKKMLIEHRDLLDELVNQLVERKTITHKTISEISHSHRA